MREDSSTKGSHWLHHPLVFHHRPEDAVQRVVTSHSAYWTRSEVHLELDQRDLSRGAHIPVDREEAVLRGLFRWACSSRADYDLEIEIDDGTSSLVA